MNFILDSRVIAILAILAITAVGLYKALSIRSALFKKLKFAEEFLQKLSIYADSDFKDELAYKWMTRYSNKMQNHLGVHGVLVSYEPPGANYLLKNVPIIINMLPQLHTFVNDEWLRGRPVTADVNTSIRDVLIRHIGNLEHVIEQITRAMYNPITHFRKGVETIVLFPIDLLASFGIFSLSMNQKAHQSLITKLLSGLVALVGLLSGLVTIVSGWQGFIGVVERLWN